jgi:flavodoxin
MTQTRTLIAFFSRKGRNYLGGDIVDLPVGNTEVAARAIQSLAGGDLFRIEPVRPYPDDYQEATQVAQFELSEDARPALAARVERPQDYEVVLLGYPNWWGTMPMAVRTFLESLDFTGKTILPFCTHEGSGLGSSEQDLRRLCPGATVRDGLAIRGGAVAKAQPAIAAWLRAAGVLP